MNIIKRVSLFLAPVLAAGSVFAEGESAGPMDAASTAATEMGTAISSLLTGAVLTNVKTIALAALGVWGLLLVVKWIRRAGR